MRQRKGMTSVLILVELGAEWPSWVEAVAARTGRRVIAQEEGESPEAFAERVGEQVNHRVAKRVPMELAVLACNERCDDRAMAARVKLGQSVVGALTTRRTFRLLFTASGRSGRVRHALSALSADLGAAWSLSGERISVRFSDEVPVPQQTANVA